MAITHHKDFLKFGDPALTHPWGKTYSPLHPKGKPNTPYPTDPEAEQEWLAREWLERMLI